MKAVFVAAGLPARGTARFELDSAASHYVSRVLRLGPGATLLLLDAGGRRCAAELLGQDPEHAEVRAITWDPPLERPDAPLFVVLLAALLKGGHFELVLQKATELGVGEVWPVVTERCVVQIGSDRSESRLARWQRICGEAARQCGRGDVPLVASPRAMAAALAQLPASTLEARFALWEAERALTLRQATSGSKPAACAVLVGPEGGLAPAEVALAQSHGFQPVSVGPRILRAETAPLAALAWLQTIWGDMG